MKKRITIFLFFFISGGVLLAQPGWNWPEDKATAEEKNVLYTDYLKMDNYKAAIEPLNWLLENAPDLNESIYINGAKIYEALADDETDKAVQTGYEEKAMEMYDNRIKYFGNEADVLNRKAYKAYKYYRDNQPKYGELKELFDKTFELNGSEVLDNNLVAYMDVIRRFKLVGGEISDEDVIDKYTVISDIVAEKAADGSNESRYAKIQDNVDKILTATVTVDCDFVESTLGPKMKESGDIKMAKKVFQLLLTGKCSDSPLFPEAAKMVNDVEPSFGLAKVIAIKAGGEGDFETAEKYYNQAVELTDDNTKKAEVYLNLAQLYYANGSKVAARSNARKAIAADPSTKEAYTLIGNLYMNSYQECKAGESKVKDRAIFIAAYKMYNRAGDSKNMANAKSQFPSMEEMFSENMNEGDNVTVGCWINETVALERRPQ